jgi:uncharacterized protein YprB with RNaseH-like and TPR domain
VLDEEIKRRIESLRLVLLREALMRPDARSDVGGVSPEDLVGASEVSGRWGRCLVIRKEVTDYIDGGALERAGQSLLDSNSSRQAVFLDLETTGLAATPMFLAGTLFERDGRLVATQLLARDYSEERALIGVLDDLLKGFSHCITFNGKSFDMPYIRERAKYHKITLEAQPLQFDLLHHARRMWRRRLPNCRLATLEYYILGRRRSGDVAGWEVPCIYHEFVHTKDARRLKGVLRHNLIDVLSMAELFACLAEARGC